MLEADMGRVGAGRGGGVEEEQVAEGGCRLAGAGGREEVDAGADAGCGGGGFLAAHFASGVPQGV